MDAGETRDGAKGIHKVVDIGQDKTSIQECTGRNKT
jgi:hypothetical protein